MMRRVTAFTLIELLVVVAIIVSLVAILLPALNKSIEIAERAVCASNQHQIHLASTSYVAENFGAFIICRGRQVTHGFDRAGSNVHNNKPGDSQVDWVEQWAKLGLMGAKMSDGRREPGEVWDCPSRTGFEAKWYSSSSLLIEYQYFGGIETWTNPYGNFKSRSPVTISSAKPGWALTADTTMKIDNVWGGGSAWFADQPSHKESGSLAPVGHNQSHVDGSVQWYDYDDLLFIHTWGGWSRITFFYQADLGDYVPPTGAMAEALR